VNLWILLIILITQLSTVSVLLPDRGSWPDYCAIFLSGLGLANLPCLWAYTAFCLYASGYPYSMFNCLSPPIPRTMNTSRTKVGLGHL
jgi:hypothetical protein